MAEKYIIEQPHKTNTMSNSEGCRTRKQQVADAGQASFGKECSTNEQQQTKNCIGEIQKYALQHTIVTNRACVYTNIFTNFID